ncbi:hypothetical protein [Mangrovicoccus ximenensis]|uniref:hypothetical protein n=1 Tax=Mangrovicoccus ximenensis TaxID=1911570 RepID=UPI001374EEFE|nr:hypothetical protein [Mangrovicoccus ximenensis]
MPFGKFLFVLGLAIAAAAVTIAAVWALFGPLPGSAFAFALPLAIAAAAWRGAPGRCWRSSTTPMSRCRIWPMARRARCASAR